MDEFKEFLIKYRGAIIGGIVAIVALILRIHEFLIGCIIVVAGVLLGNYVQQNKDDVKTKLKNWIDKM